MVTGPTSTEKLPFSSPVPMSTESNHYIKPSPTGYGAKCLLQRFSLKLRQTF